MRQKLGMAAFVVLLLAVAGGGFLWFRGDLDPSADKPNPAVVAQPTAGATASPSASPAQVPSAPGAAPAQNRGAKPAADAERMRQGLVASPPRPLPLAPDAEFTIASFNLLGTSHTVKGRSEHPGMASGPQRIDGALTILEGHGVSVVGLQEFQLSQRIAFRDRAKDWAMYPGLSLPGRVGENSVAWRSEVWELVRPALVDIPYFNGRIRQLPYVLLRHKPTGIQAYFSTFHNPANIGGNMQRYRNEATRRQIRLFNQIESTGIPQFVTGDMNERAAYFCAVTGATTLVAAAGGSNGQRCRPPGSPEIDWILGSRAAAFTDYRVDRSPLVRRTSDHAVILATVRLASPKPAKAHQPGTSSS